MPRCASENKLEKMSYNQISDRCEKLINILDYYISSYQGFQTLEPLISPEAVVQSDDSTDHRNSDYYNKAWSLLETNDISSFHLGLIKKLVEPDNIPTSQATLSHKRKNDPKCLYKKQVCKIL